MATIYDVAALAGVSPATVSRVLNGRSVSPDKERLVLEAAERLSYKPNRVARTLRRQLSEVVALVIPDIENPFFTSLARGVADTAQQAGFSVVLCNTDGDPGKERHFLDIALSEHMAGVVLAAAGTTSDVRPLLERGRAVVAVDRPVPDAEVDEVVIDNVGAGRLATRALWDAGFRDIACITGPAGLVTAAGRARGWREALAEVSPTPVADGRLVHADFRVGGGRARMSELLARADRPDAVVAGNNLVGVGALQVLHERGLSVADFGIAVIGDLPFSGHAQDVPVVHLPTRAMGTTAGALLVERIQGDEGPARRVVIPGELRPASRAAAADASPSLPRP
ncbi:LacI family DNA-binding transcriptional regulator [Geodermatophilus sp. SYSU D00815]